MLLLLALLISADTPPPKRIDLPWTLEVRDATNVRRTLHGRGVRDIGRHAIAPGWACRFDAFQVEAMGVVTLSCFAGEQSVNATGHTSAEPWVTAELALDHIALTMTALRTAQ